MGLCGGVVELCFGLLVVWVVYGCVECVDCVVVWYVDWLLLGVCELCCGCVFVVGCED